MRRETLRVACCRDGPGADNEPARRHLLIKLCCVHLRAHSVITYDYIKYSAFLAINYEFTRMIVSMLSIIVFQLLAIKNFKLREHASY